MSKGKLKTVFSVIYDTLFHNRYNAGCNHAAVGELGKAETALKKAEEVAKKFLQEEGENMK